MINLQKYKLGYLASPQSEGVHWNSYGGKNAKWKATQLQVLYVTTQVMEMSTTRGRFKKLIGLGTDIGIVDIVIGMMTTDIRGALQSCGDIAFRTYIICILICTSFRLFALMCMRWYNKGVFFGLSDLTYTDYIETL
jgi:hypothetical protein